MKHLRAFTLIETFVAITVLLISLAGPLSIAAQALKSAYYARDEITAFYLAQEGIEYVRAVRDQNYLTSAAWLTGLDPACVAPNTCEVDFPHFWSQTCGGGSAACGPLVIDANGLFEYQIQANTTPSLFTRTLTITTVAGAPDERSVTVTVSWVSAGINRSFQLSERLFNWL